MESSENMPKFTLVNVEKALHQVFHEAGEQSKWTHLFLSKAESSAEAWSFAWELLDTAKPLEVQLFGANCLYLKVSKYWRELDNENHHEQIKKLVVNKLLQFAKPFNCITRKLCQVMACVALQHRDMFIDSDGSTGFVLQLFGVEKMLNGPLLFDQFFITLEILTILPDEFQAIRMRMKSRTRLIIQRNFWKRLPSVTIFLRDMLKAKQEVFSAQQKSLLFKCLGNWISAVDSPLELLTASKPAMQATVDTMESLFQALRSGGMSEADVDTAQKLLKIRSDEILLKAGCELPDGGYLAKRSLEMVTGLQDMAVEAQKNRDMRILSTLCRMLVIAGKNYWRILFAFMVEDTEELRNIAITFLKMMTEFGLPLEHYLVDEHYSRMTVDFWCFFLKKIEPLWMDLPVLQELVNVLKSRLLKKAEYPDESCLSSWNEEIWTEFEEYREEIQDTIVVCIRTQKGPHLEPLIHRLQVICHGPFRWQDMDAWFIAVGSVGKAGYQPDAPDVCLLMEYLFKCLDSISGSHPLLISSACSMIGVFSDWFKHRANFTKVVIPLVIEGLNDRVSLPSAARTLYQLLSHEEILNSLGPSVQVLFNICQGVLNDRTEDLEDYTYIMGCVGFMCSSQTGKEHVNIWDTLSQYLASVEVALLGEITEAGKQSCVFSLKMMSQFFKGSISQTLRADWQSQWRIKMMSVITSALLIIMNSLRWIAWSAVVEAVCELLENLVELGELFLTQVELFIVELYNSNPSVAVLKLISKVAEGKTGHNEGFAVACRLVGTVIRRTLCYFEEDVNRDPVFVKEFCTIFSGMYSGCAIVLTFSLDDEENLLKIGLKIISSELRRFVLSGCRLVDKILAECSFRNRDMVSRNMHLIVDTIMEAVIMNPLGSTVQNMVNILYTCHRRFQHSFFKQMQEFFYKTDPRSKAFVYPSVGFFYTCNSKVDWIDAVKSFFQRRAMMCNKEDLLLPSISSHDELSCLLAQIKPFN